MLNANKIKMRTDFYAENRVSALWNLIKAGKISTFNKKKIAGKKPSSSLLI